MLCFINLSLTSFLGCFDTEQICQSVIKSFLFLNFCPISVYGINMKAFEKNTCDGPHSCTFWWCDLSEEWWQGDRWTSPRSHGYVPGKVGLLCPREGRGICCIANWWSLVNCRVGRKLELTNQTGLFQRSWQLQYTANLTFANITNGVISLRTNSPFSRQSSENTVTSRTTRLQVIIASQFLHFHFNRHMPLLIVSVSHVKRSVFHLCRVGWTEDVVVA